MRNGIRLIFLLLCLSATMSAQRSESLAVLDLEGRGISTAETASLTDRLRSELVKSGGVTVVERSQMEQILTEQDFQLAGCTSNECAVEVGQLLGVTSMVAGSIGQVGSTFSVDIRVIDVETGKIIHSLTRDYRGEIDGLLAEMASIASELAVAEVARAVGPVPQDKAAMAGRPESVAPRKKGRRLFWAAVGLLAAGGSYYAYTVLVGQPDGEELVGEPPALPPPP